MATPPINAEGKVAGLLKFFQSPHPTNETRFESRDITKTKVQNLRSNFEKTEAAEPSAKLKQKHVTHVLHGVMAPAALVSPAALPSPEAMASPAPMLVPAAMASPAPMLSPAAASASSAVALAPPAPLLSPAAKEAAPIISSASKNRLIAENYVSELLSSSLKFDSIIHSHAAWIETRMLLEAILDKFSSFEKEKDHLRRFLDKIKAKQRDLAAAAAMNPVQPNAQIAVRQNIIVPVGKKDSMKGPTILSNRYINQLLEASVHNFNDEEADRILSNYKWSFEDLAQLTKGRIKDCEASETSLMEFTHRLHLRFGNNLDERSARLISDIIRMGISVANPRVSILSRLVAQKTGKHMNFVQAHVVEQSPSQEYTKIKRNIVKNKNYDADLEKVAVDLKNKAICLLMAIL